MKVTVSRASERFNEYETELDISQDLLEQLRNLGKVIPFEENSASWDLNKDESTSFVFNIDPDTGEVEIMIYDYYVE